MTIVLREEREGEALFEADGSDLAYAAAASAAAAAPLASSLWGAFKQTDTYASISRWTEERMASVFARVRWVPEERRVEIRGIDYPKLLARAEAAYGNKEFAGIFGRKYAFFKQLTYDWKWRKKLHPEDISYLSFHHFFALEVAEVFSDLAVVTGLRYYEAVSAQIWKRTWLARYLDPPALPPLPLGPADALRYKLLPHQSEFVAGYPALKARLDMRGVLLSFDQGLGKTLTAAALAECLGKTRVYVVCPNPLRENWLGELRRYYGRYDDPGVLAREVYVQNMPGQAYSGRACRWVIVNNEAIEKIQNTVADADPASTMLVVDEGQNFRNPDGLRTKQLLALRESLACEDVLPMSGTPIKASPSEIVPALLLLDRLFDAEAARAYSKLFSMDDAAAARIVRARFGRVIYRKVKSEVLSLPPKTEVLLRLPVPDAEPYLLKNVKDRIAARFEEIYAAKLLGTAPLVAAYRALVLAHAAGPASERDRYLLWVDNRAARNDANQAWHELTVSEMESYHARRILPNLSPDERKSFMRCYTQLVQMRQSAMGLAIGEILPKARRDLYLAIWGANKAAVTARIAANPNKTIVFTVFREVAERIHADLAGSVGSVLVYGGTGDRSAQIQRFKSDDDVSALVATSQTLATGVTLTEADAMYFFGTPWRDADYQQASDRFHRIGQVNPVTVYNVVLDDPRPNLSSRMQDILSWSGAMFGAMVDERGDSQADRWQAAAAVAERADLACAAGLLDTAHLLMEEARALAGGEILLEGAAAGPYEVPEGAKAAARRGLELRAKHRRGGTEVGVNRAKQLISSRAVDAHTVKQMHAYFARHSVDKAGRGWDDEANPSAGKIAWLLWGGDEGKRWADARRAEM